MTRVNVIQKQIRTTSRSIQELGHVVLVTRHHVIDEAHRCDGPRNLSFANGFQVPRTSLTNPKRIETRVTRYENEYYLSIKVMANNLQFRKENEFLKGMMQGMIATYRLIIHFHPLDEICDIFDTI